MVILQAAAPTTEGKNVLDFFSSNFSNLFLIILIVVIIVIYIVKKYHKDSDIKYPALNIISGFYKLLAEIIAVLSIVITIYLLIARNQYNDNNNIILSITSFSATSIFLCGIITSTVLFAIAEAIRVFIAIEENTRNTASIFKVYWEQNIKEESKIFSDDSDNEVAKDDK